MKKLYTKRDYKILHQRRQHRLERCRSQLKLHGGRRSHPQSNGARIHSNRVGIPVIAPSDFRLIENPEACLLFLKDIRSPIHRGRSGVYEYVEISLKHVNQIDYASISILTAISEDFTSKHIAFRGDFPDNVDCKQFIIDSGFLDRMYQTNGRHFDKTDKSDLILFEKGCGVLSVDDNIKISKTIKRIVKHLTGEERHCLAVKTIILEICGNSIEWANTGNKQWLLGTKYEENNVVITVVDIGQGILNTLHRKFPSAFVDMFTLKPKEEILLGAFDQKYGSTSKEENRNTGLPAIKASYEAGLTSSLKVLTNDVILHFDDKSRSSTFKRPSMFKGTFYQWIMTKENILKC